MTSNLSVNLDFGQSEGKLIQRRDMQISQGILYNKATVALVDRLTSSVNLSPGDSASLFRRNGVDNNRTYFSKNIVYSGADLFTFLYRGVYRIRARVIYNPCSPLIGDLILQVNTSDGGLLDQRTAIVRNSPTGVQVVAIDYIVQANALVSVVLTNQTNQTVNALDSSPAGRTPFVEAVYLGAL